MESYSLNCASVNLVAGYYAGAQIFDRGAGYHELRITNYTFALRIKPDFVIEKGGEEVTLTRST